MSGVPLTAFALASTETIIVLMELGAASKYGKELQAIRNSLRSNDQTVQEMLDVLK